MPELSTRTLEKVISVLDALVPSDDYGFGELGNFWRTKLFGAGFPPWFVELVQNCHTDWSIVIPSLYNGEAATRHERVGPQLSDQMLRKLTVFAFQESDEGTRENLRLSLQLDGFEVSQENLTPIDGPISVEQEKSRLLSQLMTSKLRRKDVIKQHITEAEMQFSQGANHPAIGEARSALQAVIEETVALTEAKVGANSGSGVVNQIDFLQKHQILSPDEQSAFKSAWNFLCSGNHPGMSTEEGGRIGVILCLEFIQILLIKCRNLNL